MTHRCRQTEVSRFEGLTRRSFVCGAGALLAGAMIPANLFALGASSQIDLVQIVYGGGNWQPRPTALRRLAWEVHKRTAVDTILDPSHSKASANLLANSPFAYLCGDRPFTPWEAPQQDGLSRFLRLGGTLVIDPAFTPDGDAKGFEKSVDQLISKVMPNCAAVPILPGHLIFRTFYNLSRAVGRMEGSAGLVGHEVGGRAAIIRTNHDMGGAWAKDNLGNWEFDVVPGGERQRENAFRLGVNIVMYALCIDYKDEEPHRRFGQGT